MADFKINIKNIIAVIAVLCSFGVIFVLAFVEIPKENKSIFDVLFGLILSQAIVPIFRHFYPTKKEEPIKP